MNLKGIRSMKREKTKNSRQRLERRRKEKGITLIALIVTVIVLLILAGISITALTGDKGVIGKAITAKDLAEFSRYKEELEEFMTKKKVENRDFYDESLNVSSLSNSLMYNTKKAGENGTIKDVIPSMKDYYVGKFEIIKGEFLLNTKNKNEIKVAQDLRIKVNPYDIVDGVLLSSSGNLLLVDNQGAITIPSSVTKIDSGAFANTTETGGNELKKIIIPGTVKEIAADAFSYNTTLEEVIMEDGVTKVGDSAFRNCSSLKKIVFPDTVTSIGSYCLYQCTSLVEVKVSKNITIMPERLLGNCTNLEKIEIPEGVTTLGYATLGNCIKISRLEFPRSLKVISSAAFNRMISLSEIIIPANNENFKFENELNEIKSKFESTANTNYNFIKEIEKISENKVENLNKMNLRFFLQETSLLNHQKQLLFYNQFLLY